jgi:cysteine dioxygenase
LTDDLQAMFRHLDTLTVRPDLDRLVKELSRFEIDLDDLSGHLHFAENGYKRNLVRAGTCYQAWLLCWKNGQRSPIHNHSGSAC